MVTISGSSKPEHQPNERLSEFRIFFLACLVSKIYLSFATASKENIGKTDRFSRFSLFSDYREWTYLRRLRPKG